MELTEKQCRNKANMKANASMNIKAACYIVAPHVNNLMYDYKNNYEAESQSLKMSLWPALADVILMARMSLVWHLVDGAAIQDFAGAMAAMVNPNVHSNEEGKPWQKHVKDTGTILSSSTYLKLKHF